MRISGIQPEELSGWKDTVSETQLGQMLGNSVPVPLIQAVLSQALEAAGLKLPAKA